MFCVCRNLLVLSRTHYTVSKVFWNANNFANFICLKIVAYIASMSSNHIVLTFYIIELNIIGFFINEGVIKQY